MADRRPLVLVNGRTKELPAGDRITGQGLTLLVVRADGTPARVPMDTENRLPVYTAAGEYRPIALEGT